MSQTSDRRVRFRDSAPRESGLLRPRYLGSLRPDDAAVDTDADAGGHDRSARVDQEIRLGGEGGDRRGSPVVPGQAGQRHRIPGTERRGKVHHDADILGWTPPRRAGPRRRAALPVVSPSTHPGRARCWTRTGSEQGRARQHRLAAMAAANGIDRHKGGRGAGAGGADKVARKEVGRFCLGMKQRLGMAGAMLGEPQCAVSTNRSTAWTRRDPVDPRDAGTGRAGPDRAGVQPPDQRDGADRRPSDRDRPRTG